MNDAVSNSIRHELRTEMACGSKPGHGVPSQDPQEEPRDPEVRPGDVSEPPARPMPYTPRDETGEVEEERMGDSLAML